MTDWLTLWIYLAFLQWMVAGVVTSAVAPLRWSTIRVIWIALVWPGVLIVFMVAKPVKALRHGKDPQLAVDQLARQHRKQSSIDIDHGKSVIFWRGHLNADSAVEREVAVRMLTEVYDVPLEEPEPDTDDVPIDPRVVTPTALEVRTAQAARMFVGHASVVPVQAGTICVGCGGAGVRTGMYPPRCPLCHGTGGDGRTPWEIVLGGDWDAR